MMSVEFGVSAIVSIKTLGYPYNELNAVGLVVLIYLSTVKGFEKDQE